MTDRAERAMRRLAKHLREKAPPLLPVWIYVRDEIKVDGQHVGGTAELRGTGDRARFIIEIQRGDEKFMRDTLIHEWGHCLSWECGELIESDHGELFQKAHKRVKRIARGFK